MLGERNYSVGVFRSGVLTSGFLIVTGLAQRLPVRVAPHQVVTASVRNNMIDNSCRHILSLRQTLHAQRVLPQVHLADTLPLAAIAMILSIILDTILKKLKAEPE